MTVEPRVEDLLATIRKAIDDDLNGLDQAATTSNNSKGKLLRGALREMRVNYQEPTPDPQLADREIAELRDRISRSRNSSFPAVSAAPTPPPPRVVPRQTPKAGGMGSILAGSGRAQLPHHSPAPPLRLGYDDFPPEPEKEAYREPAWQEDHHQHADYYAPQPAYEPQAAPPLLSPRSAQHAQSSFEHLAESLMSRATGDRSIEDMTRELLRGLLKQWLDDNLPQMVEQMVREEIERVARRGR